MSRKGFAIELGSGSPSDRRLREALDLAAGLAAFDHRVELLLRAPAVARLGGAPEDDELRDGLDSAADLGIGPALTDTIGAPDHLGALALVHGDLDSARAQADAVLVF